MAGTENQRDASDVKVCFGTSVSEFELNENFAWLQAGALTNWWKLARQCYTMPITKEGWPLLVPILQREQFRTNI